jgi:hypothetical protein
VRPFLRTFIWAGVVLGLTVPAAAAASEPAVSTGAAIAITSTSATLDGTVNPEGEATSYYFQYGTTTSYGSQTATASAGAASANVNVSAPLASLAPNTTYHYRLVATNPSGTTLGSDVSFRTPKPPAPTVVTKRPTAVTQTSATLTGTVNPQGEATRYFFQYGTSIAYGGQSQVGDAGSGNGATGVSAAIGALTPNTTYHFRLVASNAAGTTYGHDASFKTAVLPAGVTITASSGAITFGQTVSLSGRVLPPRPSRVIVTLQSAPGAGGPWIVTSISTATAAGAYSFRPAPGSNGCYRVLADGATSSPACVLVRFRVGLRVSRRHARPRSLVRFYGEVAPPHFWHRVLLEWLSPRGRWITIKRTRLAAARGGHSFYSVRARVDRNGRYRVVVGPDAHHARGLSQAVRIRVP